MKAVEFFDDNDINFESVSSDDGDDLGLENVINLNIKLMDNIKLDENLILKKEEKNLEYYHALVKKNFGDNFSSPLEILKEMQENSIEVNIDTFNILLYNAFNNKCEESFQKLKDILLANNVLKTEEIKGSIMEKDDLKENAKENSKIEEEKELKVEKEEKVEKIVKEEVEKVKGSTVPIPIPNHITMIILLKNERYKTKGLLMNLRNVSNPSNENEKREEIFKNFDNQLDEIKNLFIPFGLKPTLQVENTIIDIYMEQKRFMKAWEYFQTIKEIADQYTYSSILKGIQLSPNLSNDWLDKAFDIMNQAQEKFVELEEIFLNTLLDVCIKFNRIDKAEKLFFDMREKKDDLSEHTYSIMIKAYGKIKNLDKAVYIFDEIKNNFEFPSSITYGCMMNLYVKCGHTDLAKNLMIEMDGKGIKQNLHTYSTLINGYRLARNCNSALAVFDRAIKEKDQNIVIYNAILDCCIQCEDYKKMKEIFLYLNINSKNNDKFPQPDLITYSIVMKGLAKTNDVERVLEVYTYLLERKDFTLDKYMYNTIMDFFAKKKEEKNVIMVYNDMLSRNVEIEIVTYGVLIKLYCNLNNCNKALELYNELLKKNMKPNVVILQLLLKVMFRNKSNVDKAIVIFRNLKTINIQLDNIIYELVITNCLKFHRYSEAFEFYLRGCVDELEMNEEIYRSIIETVIYSEKLDANKKKALLKRFVKELEDKKIKCEDVEIEKLSNGFLNDKLELNDSKHAYKLKKQNDFDKTNGFNGFQNKNQYYNQGYNTNQETGHRQGLNHYDHHNDYNEYNDYNGKSGNAYNKKFNNKHNNDSNYSHKNDNSNGNGYYKQNGFYNKEQPEENFPEDYENDYENYQDNNYNQKYRNKYENNTPNYNKSSSDNKSKYNNYNNHKNDNYNNNIMNSNEDYAQQNFNSSHHATNHSNHNNSNNVNNNIHPKTNKQHQYVSNFTDEAYTNKNYNYNNINQNTEYQYNNKYNSNTNDHSHNNHNYKKINNHNKQKSRNGSNNNLPNMQYETKVTTTIKPKNYNNDYKDYNSYNAYNNFNDFNDFNDHNYNNEYKSKKDDYYKNNYFNEGNNFNNNSYQANKEDITIQNAINAEKKKSKFECGNIQFNTKLKDIKPFIESEAKYIVDCNTYNTYNNQNANNTNFTSNTPYINKTHNTHHTYNSYSNQKYNNYSNGYGTGSNSNSNSNNSNVPYKAKHNNQYNDGKGNKVHTEYSRKYY